MKLRGMILAAALVLPAVADGVASVRVGLLRCCTNIATNEFQDLGYTMTLALTQSNTDTKAFLVTLVTCDEIGESHAETRVIPRHEPLTQSLFLAPKSTPVQVSVSELKADPTVTTQF